MKRYLKAGILATLLGGSAQVYGAEKPELITFLLTPPVERSIKVEIGFEPGPSDASPSRLPAPVLSIPHNTKQPILPPATPSTPEVIQAVVRPGTLPALQSIEIPAVATPAAEPVTLAALQRMALGRPTMNQAHGANSIEPPRADGVREVNAAARDEVDTVGFVDQAIVASMQPGTIPVPAPAGASQARALAGQYRMLNNVRLRYYHLLALQRLAAVREEMIGLTRDAIIAVDGMNGTGQATKAELLQARTEAREQVVAAENARAAYQVVWSRMAKSLANPELPVAPVAGELERSCGIPDFETAWTHVRTASPELIAIRGNVAQRQVHLRRFLAGDSSESGAAGGQGPISQALSRLNGQAANRDPQITQTAWTDLTRGEAELQRAEQSLKQRLAVAYQRWDRARGIVDVYRNSNLPESKEAYELSVQAYRKGQGSWPQVLMAQRNYFRLSIDYVEAVAELRRAELSILGLSLDGQQ